MLCGGYFAFRAAHPNPEHSESAARLQGGRDLLRVSRLTRSTDPGERARGQCLRRDYDAWFAEVLARNPGIEPDWLSIPDHQNGFLQWLEFCEAHQVDGELGSESLDIPPDIAAIIDGSQPWDADTVAAFLAERSEFLAEVTRIGLLPARSVAGISIDRWSFVGARFTKQSTDLLLADARLAAEAGDSERALGRVRAAMGLAGHYDLVEAPSLLMETVSILVRLGVQAQTIEHLLPALAPDPASLGAWRDALQAPKFEPAAFAKLLRGECWTSLRGLAIPLLADDIDGIDTPEVPDADAFLDAHAQAYLSAATTTSTASLADFLASNDADPWFPPVPPHLSEEAREAYGMLQIGARVWSRGWARAAVLSARTDAALALLAGEQPPPDPVTGQPFVFDPETRTLHVPDDPQLRELISEPLKLP